MSFRNPLKREVAAEQVKLALEVFSLEEQEAAVGLGDGVLRERRSALSAVVHKYGDVFSGRIEFRSPSFDALRTGFDPSRRRDTPAPPQGERIRKRIYEMLHVGGVSKTKS